jgi:hypothetical protein
VFDSRPYHDYRADRLFFAQPGTSFSITFCLDGSLLKLMGAAGKLQRFVDAIDRVRFWACCRTSSRRSRRMTSCSART